jgi:hypothetical protein
MFFLQQSQRRRGEGRDGTNNVYIGE